MSKNSFEEMNCPIAQTLEQVGEWWTFVILRNAFCGVSRFQDFQRHLGISTSILARRLEKLVENGILKNYVSNTYTGRKLGIPSTGNASRGLAGTPGIGAGNFFLQPGSVTPEALIATSP